MTTWKPTLIGWLLERFGSYLTLGLEDGGLHWVQDADGEQLRIVDKTAATLARLTIRLAWPHALASFTRTRWLAVDFQPADSADPAVLTPHVTRFGERLAELEQRLDRPFSALFPRDPQGNIDWARSPLSTPGPGMKHEGGTGMLKLGDIPCGLRCAFCTRSLWPDYPAPPDLFWMGLLYRTALELGQTRDPEARILIGSGEPGRHPDLASIIRLARHRGYRHIWLETSAIDRLFPDRIHTLAGAGLTAINFPLYAENAAVHDAVVGQEGHYDLIRTAMEVLKAAGVQVRIHSIPLTVNADHIAGLPDLCARLGAHFEGFQYPRQEGDSRIPYAQLAPRLSDLPQAVTRHLNLSIPCLGIVGTQKPPREAGLYRELVSRRGGESDRALETEYAPQCARCRKKPACTGVYQGYLARHGTEEFKPQ